MREDGGLREMYSKRIGHGVMFDTHLCFLKLPWLMVDLAHKDIIGTTAFAIEGIPLR